MAKMDESEIVVRLVKMPGAVRGYTCPSCDGVNNVYVNRSLPVEMRNKVIRHELDHIRKNDFNSERAVIDLEADITDAASQAQ